MSDKNIKNKEENLHAGHRERVKQQILAGTINENSPPHILLEALLYFSVPRRDTNPIAHRLINHFGSLGAVLCAPDEELLKIDGITKNTVALFRVYALVTKRFAMEKTDSKDEMHSTDEIGEYLKARYTMRKGEWASLLCIKPSGKVLSFEFIGEGDIASVGISTRRILEIAIKCGANIVILAHNHPSGIALPSAIDIEITKGLISSLRQVGITLADHIIVTDDDYVSMAQSAEYNQLF